MHTKNRVEFRARLFVTNLCIRPSRSTENVALSSLARQQPLASLTLAFHRMAAQAERLQVRPKMRPALAQWRDVVHLLRRRPAFRALGVGRQVRPPNLHPRTAVAAWRRVHRFARQAARPGHGWTTAVDAADQRRHQTSALVARAPENAS